MYWYFLDDLIVINMLIDKQFNLETIAIYIYSSYNF